MTQGRWSLQEQEWHISYQELMAVWLALKEFQRSIRNCRVVVKSDNMTTCYYINKGGGTRSYTLCHLAIKMWDWCIWNNIEIRATHVLGVLNVLADTRGNRSTRGSGVSTDY